MSRTVAVVGYASLDSTTAIAEFRGINATSILNRSFVDSAPSAGGIAHLARAVAEAGADPIAISWVGSDLPGKLWTEAISTGGADTSGICTIGSRSPSATLIEVGTGGTICFFDRGDCHPDALTAEQIELITTSEWVLLTVSPSSITSQILDILPPTTQLVWAVKQDEHAYPPPLLIRMLERANILSFSHGERAWLSVDGVEPEKRASTGSLVIETRGKNGARWSFATPGGAVSQAAVAVTPVDASDTTGAGDTFIGWLTGLLAASSTPSSFSALGAELEAAIGAASAAASEHLRRRNALSAPPHTSPKENTPHVD